MGDASQPGVEADLSHLVCPSQEKVDDAIGDHAVGEALDDMMETSSHVETVSILLSSFYRDGLSVGGGVACSFTHSTAHLHVYTHTHTRTRARQSITRTDTSILLY